MIDPRRRIVLLEKMAADKTASLDELSRKYDGLLEKIKGGVDKAAKTPIGGVSMSDLGRNLSEGVWSGPGKLGKAGYESTSEKLKRWLLGKKATSGPQAGKRLHAVPGGLGEGIKQISKAEYDAVKAGKKAGEVMTGKVGKETAYFGRKFRPKGLAGLVMKHPGKSGLAALAAYWLLKDKGSRQAAGQVASQIAPKPQRGLTADAQKEWAKELNYSNPLAEKAWG
tara:strand:- start:8927 stop:9601 length:675 start_codon:yes stop_codon:yes gene_type:complete